jgi:hypothetical protein
MTNQTEKISSTPQYTRAETVVQYNNQFQYLFKFPFLQTVVKTLPTHHK